MLILNEGSRMRHDLFAVCRLPFVVTAKNAHNKLQNSIASNILSLKNKTEYANY